MGYQQHPLTSTWLHWAMFLTAINPELAKWDMAQNWIGGKRLKLNSSRPILRTSKWSDD